MVLSAAPPQLTPAQQMVIEHLGATRGDRPAFSADLADRLRAELEEGLAPLSGELDGERPLVVTKRAIAGVLGCQAHHLADQRFDWSVPVARGTVAHKAIELSVHVRGEPTPLDLVGMAVSRLSEGNDGLADWLRSCSDAERAELLADANDRVATFLECWPPLPARWIPVTESRAKVEDLCGGRVRLVAKVDLTLGRAEGTTAGKVLVDLKTGSFSPDHRHDLRFYALVETLKLGVPPRRVASYYLESARMVPEDVGEDLLSAAVARTVAGVTAMVALRRPDTTPIRRSGPACGWCPIRRGCPDGEAWFEREGAFG